ncbi:putative aminotransferase [Escherichia coli]|nr:putative aminotransferase [Escherichia coli]
MSPIEKSSKLENVCYDIRGPVLKEAKRLEEEGNKVLKLNIGNPAPFGFDAPDEILVDVIRNLPTAQGYCDSKGLYSARKAIMQHYQARGMRDVTVEDIYIGNGVSELIVQAMQALLNSGDEMLVPAPDYPLWTAAVRFPAVKRCIIFAMNPLTGSRTSMIFALKLRLVRVGSLLSTQITQPARYIPKSF